MGIGNTSRRRGKALDQALLDAVWAELTESGYANLTLNSVAKRAGTSKSVLYRRWKNRTELATAAIKRHFEHTPINVPDLGNLRDELLLLLRRLLERSTPTALRLMLSMGENVWRQGSDISTLKAKINDERALEEILRRALDRHEIDLLRISPEIKVLPKSLLRPEVLMQEGVVTEEFITSVVDDIFLPLITRSRS